MLCFACVVNSSKNCPDDANTVSYVQSVNLCLTSGSWEVAPPKVKTQSWDFPSVNSVHLGQNQP